MCGHYLTRYKNELKNCNRSSKKSQEPPRAGGLRKLHSSTLHPLTERLLWAGPPYTLGEQQGTGQEALYVWSLW